MADGLSAAGQLFEATRRALEANHTAAAWREVLGSALELARDLAVREDLGSILSLDSTAWDALRADARRESIRLRDYYNSLADLDDADELGPESGELYLRAVQRVYLLAAGFREGTDHMLAALARIAPDIVEQAQSYVEQGADFWSRNRWWIIPGGLLLAGGYVLRSVRRTV